jgi:uncharacterized membrane protein
MAFRGGGAAPVCRSVPELISTSTRVTTARVVGMMTTAHFVLSPVVLVFDANREGGGEI